MLGADVIFILSLRALSLLAILPLCVKFVSTIIILLSLVDAGLMIILSYHINLLFHRILSCQISFFLHVILVGTSLKLIFLLLKILLLKVSIRTRQVLHHVTFDLASLPISDDYKGKNSVLVDDGALLPILHIDSSFIQSSRSLFLQDIFHVILQNPYFLSKNSVVIIIAF